MLVFVEEISHQAFAPYGSLIEHSSDALQANQGTAYRQNWHTRVESLQRPNNPQVELNVCTFNCQSRSLPLDLKLLERHKYSSQLFQPVTESDYLVVVAEHQGGPIKAFRVRNQGINYKPGVWHHPMINLSGQSQLFLCLVNEQVDGNGKEDDCEEVAIEYRVSLKMHLVASGKVRSLYSADDKHLLVVTSDRISAYDVILKSLIPNKAQILTQLTKFWLEYFETAGVLGKPFLQFDGVRHHLVTTQVNEMPQEYSEFIRSENISSEGVMLVRKLKVAPIEAIVRGYLAGSMYKEYCNGQTSLPAGLQDGSKLPQPIFTPSTKAEYGDHDENISYEQMKSILKDDALSERIKSTALKIYNLAAQYALSKGIIIADTKFEFGIDSDGNLYLVDEVLTPDSSRFWPLSEWSPGSSQPSYDKQFVRDYLTSINFDKKTPVELPQDVIDKTANKYQQVLDLLRK